MVNPIPHLITEDYINSLIASEAKKVSYCNGDYWWELRTPIIERNIEILIQHAEDWFDEIINEQTFLIHLHTYFKVVYDESLKAWKEERGWTDEPKVQWFDPIPCVSLTFRELQYINARWGDWCAKDGEPNLEGLAYEYNPGRGEFFMRTPFTNDIGPQEYEDIRPSGIIGSLDYVMRWGKRKDWSLKMILERDVKYFQWLLTIDKLKFSDEIKQAVERQFLKEAFWD